MNHTLIGTVVLVAFAMSFVAICVWALWPSNRSKMKDYGQIPLDEDRDNDE